MKKSNYSICPITYEKLTKEERYSNNGLRMLSPKLHDLNDLPYSADEQRIEARLRSNKISIQGVQPKVSAVLDIQLQRFRLCDEGGNYIIKPQNENYPELPENEDLTMRLAADFIEVPLHGLIYSADGSMSYFIKRFDRQARGNKLAVEDLSQIAGLNRDTKYNYSMEKIVPLLDMYCTFPAIEKINLFKRTIFNFLVGNEDMHLKNFSLITRDGKVELAPAYDFINTTIAIGNAKEQIALPLRGKKNNLKKTDLIDYYGLEKLGINLTVINSIMEQIEKCIPKWQNLIAISFLTIKSKDAYLRLLDDRLNILMHKSS